MTKIRKSKSVSRLAPSRFTVRKSELQDRRKFIDAERLEDYKGARDKQKVTVNIKTGGKHLTLVLKTEERHQKR